MSEQEHRVEPEPVADAPHPRSPLIFPAGDLDAMIFHEEYTVPHSQR